MQPCRCWPKTNAPTFAEIVEASIEKWRNGMESMRLIQMERLMFFLIMQLPMELFEVTKALMEDSPQPVDHPENAVF